MTKGRKPELGFNRMKVCLIVSVNACIVFNTVECILELLLPTRRKGCVDVQLVAGNRSSFTNCFGKSCNIEEESIIGVGRKGCPKKEVLAGSVVQIVIVGHML
jgi:hypothetical protein